MATGPAQPGVGIIAGRFMIPHTGHEYLVNFARRFGPPVHLHVVSRADDVISAPKRIGWLREIFHGVEIDLHQVPDALEKNSGPELTWIAGRIRARHQGRISALYSSDAEERHLAAMLGASWTPANPMRTIFPVSSSAILQNPLKHWEFLPPCVRPHFVMKVCLVGPESTGKSYLAARLAAHFKTVFSPEYARTHAEARGNVLLYEDSALIAAGHAASEDALARHANRVLFCDTDTITTVLWSEELYNDCFSFVREWADLRVYHLHLLLDTGVPWEPDPIRCHSEEADRQRFFGRLRDALESRGRNFRVIGGDWETRFHSCCAAVEEMLSKHGA